MNYTVKNTGNATEVSAWVDSVFLSTSGAIDASAVLLGRVAHSGTVAANGSYPGSLTAAVPPVLPGNYFIVVEVDSRGLVPDANRATTVLATTSPALVTAPSLTIGGMAATGTAVMGQPVVYAIADSTGADFNLELTSGASGTMSLLAGYQSVPTSNNAVLDVEPSFNTPTQATSVPYLIQGGQAGTDYVVLTWQGPGPSASYSLSASAVALSVNLPYPASAPASNSVTLSIAGTGFTSATRVSLVSGPMTIPADQVMFEGSQDLEATFNLSTASPGGDYAIEVSDNGRAASTAASFAVIAAPSGTTVSTGQDNASIVATLEAPSAVRPGREYSLTVNYYSTALVGSAVQAPLLLLSANNVEFQLPGQSGFSPDSIMLLGTNAPGQGNASVGSGLASTAPSSPRSFPARSNSATWFRVRPDRPTRFTTASRTRSR